VEPVLRHSINDVAAARSQRNPQPIGLQPKTRSLVYLARHGQTESNVLGRYAGYSAEPLTETGRGQMSALAARLGLRGIAEIWTSEVARARESADLVGRILAVPVRVDQRLNEMRLGPWEGLTEVEVAQRFPNEHALWCTLPDRLVLEGRETLGALATRVTAAVNDAAHRAHSVLLMTHVAPVRVAALTAMGVPLSSYKLLHVGNGDVVIVDHGTADARRPGESRSLRDELPLAGAESSLA